MKLIHRIDSRSPFQEKSNDRKGRNGILNQKKILILYFFRMEKKIVIVLTILLPIAHSFFQLSTSFTINTPNPITVTTAAGSHLFIGANDASNNTLFYHYDSELHILTDLGFSLNSASLMKTKQTNTNTTGEYLVASQKTKTVSLINIGTGQAFSATLTNLSTTVLYDLDLTPPRAFCSNSALKYVEVINVTYSGLSVYTAYNVLVYQSEDSSPSKYLSVFSFGHNSSAVLVLSQNDLTVPGVYLLVPSSVPPVINLCQNYLVVYYASTIRVYNIWSPYAFVWQMVIATNILSFSCVGNDRFAIHTSDGNLSLYQSATKLLLETIVCPFAPPITLHSLYAPTFEGLWVIHQNQVMIYGISAPPPPPAPIPIPIPTPPTPTPTPTIPSTNQMVDNWSNKTSLLIGKILAYTSIKVIFKIVVPFTLFLEELSLYKYHHNITYSYFMAQCMEQVSIINIIKNKPKILDYFTFNTSIGHSVALDFKYIYQNNVGMGPKAGLFQTNIYFLQAIKTNIAFGLISNFLIFWIFRLLAYVLTRLSHTCSELKILKSLALALNQRTRIWILFFAIMDSNLTDFSFNCFNQLSLSFNFGWESGINSVIAVCSLFVGLIYAILSYVLARRLSFTASLNLIIFSHQSRKGFITQGCIYCLFRFLRGMCHSNIFYSHIEKLIMVIGLECFIIFSIIFLRRGFINKMAFLMHLVYYVSFLCLDVLILAHSRYFLLHLTLAEIAKGIECFILIILALTLLKVIMIAIKSAKELVRQCYKFRNSISPEDIQSIQQSKAQAKNALAPESRLLVEDLKKKKYPNNPKKTQTCAKKDLKKNLKKDLKNDGRNILFVTIRQKTNEEPDLQQQRFFGMQPYSNNEKITIKANIRIGSNDRQRKRQRVNKKPKIQKNIDRY